MASNTKLNIDIQLISEKIDRKVLVKLANAQFKTFVKFVVDIKTGQMAVGGELHSDAELLLLENGADRSNLWGGNYFLNKPSDQKIEFTSLINIRPKDNNVSMEIEDDKIRKKITTLVETLLMSSDDNLA